MSFAFSQNFTCNICYYRDLSIAHLDFIQLFFNRRAAGSIKRLWNGAPMGSITVAFARFFHFFQLVSTSCVSPAINDLNPGQLKLTACTEPTEAFNFITNCHNFVHEVMPKLAAIAPFAQWHSFCIYSPIVYEQHTQRL